MGVEIERKFLLKNEAWKKNVEKSHHIQQAYLNLDQNKTVRVRILDDKGILTIKGKTIGRSRLEFEYEIPYSDAQQLLGLCEPAILKKTRHKVTYKKHTWEIDVFEGVNQGLIVAEVELSAENESVQLPDWVGEEVSDQVKYYNSNLIKHPFKNW